MQNWSFRSQSPVTSQLMSQRFLELGTRKMSAFDKMLLADRSFSCVDFVFPIQIMYK